MSFFSKIFKSSPPQPELPEVPAGASSPERILIAVNAAIAKTGGNCATLESPSDSSKWLQIMGDTLNAHYHHAEPPEERFPNLIRHNIISELLTCQAGVFMTVSLRDINPAEITAWIETYFSQVLSVDLATNPLVFRMEDL